MTRNKTTQPPQIPALDEQCYRACGYRILPAATTPLNLAIPAVRGVRRAALAPLCYG